MPFLISMNQKMVLFGLHAKENDILDQMVELARDNWHSTGDALPFLRHARGDYAEAEQLFREVTVFLLPLSRCPLIQLGLRALELKFLVAGFVSEQRFRGLNLFPPDVADAGF